MSMKSKAALGQGTRRRDGARAIVATAPIALVLVAIGFLAFAPGASAQTTPAEDSNVSVHYMEIVTNDVDALCATYERVHGLSFGPEDPDLGQARVAVRADGSLVGIRRPLAEHEKPTMRTYLAVEDIEKAVAAAEAAGAVTAYPPTKQGERGTFAIVIQGNVEHGLWQR